MLNTKVLKDPQANELFLKKGYVKYGKVDDAVVKELLSLNKKLDIPDFFNCGFNVGMNSDVKKLREAMQREIKEIVTPFTDRMLEDYRPYTASYLNKLPREDCFVIAHQDFTYTDEELYPSFMCFIPLVDTSLENAALGFVPGSHLFFDYIRAFPFPGVPTPVTENCTELMLYFDIIPMKAGEMIFFSHNTIHGSFSNYGNKARPAVGMSFIKEGTDPYLFVHNPQTQSRTILKYKADVNSLVNFNNPYMKSMFESGKIDLPYELLDEFEYIGVDTSWEFMESKLKEKGLSPNPAYNQLVHDYRKIQVEKTKPKRSLFQRIKETF